MTTTASEHDEKVRDFFDANVAGYDAFYEEGSALGRWFNRVFRKAVYLRRDEVTALARKHECKTVLDVGCGSGRNTVWWAHHGIERLLGVDISREMIDVACEVARQLNVDDRCRFEHVDFMRSDPNERFDMVVACGVFDYVEDAEPFLRHMARYANKIVYGSFPGWTLVRSPFRKLRYAFQGCPLHFYRRAELERLFDAVGFGRLEIKPVPSGHLAWAVND